MIIVGIILLVIGFILKIAFVWAIGILLLLVGWSWPSSARSAAPWAAAAITGDRASASRIQGCRPIRGTSR
jgi:hypothetical protein